MPTDRASSTADRIHSSAVVELWIAFLVPHLLTLVVLRVAGREHRRAAAVFSLAVLVYFLPYLVQQQTPVSLDFLYDQAPWEAAKPDGYLQKNFLLNDVPLQMMPWHEEATRQARSGHLPFLNRFTGSGTPLWENLQVALLFPSTLLSLPLSTFAWPMLASVFKILVALWGMYFFLRQLGLGTNARLLGSLAWGFGVFMVVFLEFPHTNVTALLPWMLFAIGEVVRRRSSGSVAGASLVVFLMFAGGHPESVLHCGLIAIPWAFAEIVRLTRHDRLVVLGRLSAAVVVGMLLAGPVLVAFARYLPQTQRVHDIESTEGFLASPPFTIQNLVPFIVPNYFGNPRVHNYRHAFPFNEVSSQYVGLAVLVLALVSIASAPRKHLRWIVLLAVCIALAFHSEFVVRMLEGAPILGETAHSRIRFAIGFILAVLAAFGLEALTEEKPRRIARVLSVVAFATVAATCVLSYPVFAEYGIRRLVFFTELAALTSVALLAWMTMRRPRWGSTLLVMLVFLDVVSVAPLYNAGNGRDLAFPLTPAIETMTRDRESGPFRVLGLERALQPATSVFYGLEDIRVHDPMSYQPYVAVLDRAGFDRTTYFGTFRWLPSRSLLDFLGVRYVMTPPAADTLDLPLVYGGADGKVYENPSRMARFFVPDDVWRADDPLEFLTHVDARVVFVEEDVPAIGPARIEVLRYEPDAALLRVESSSLSFVASSEVALPGWTLFFNGTEWPLRRINGVFLGWTVPAGGGEFELVYRPKGLEAGVASFLLGLVLIATMIGGAIRGVRPVRTSSEENQSAGETPR